LRLAERARIVPRPHSRGEPLHSGVRQCSGMTPERVSDVSRFARPAR
jgi:hypothetical protein